MIVTFNEEYLHEMYEEGKTTDKKHRFQPEVIDIFSLTKATKPEDLYKQRSLNYEKLKGDKKDISSIKATKKYRIEFTEESDRVGPVITICNILELSNHYKK